MSELGLINFFITPVLFAVLFLTLTSSYPSTDNSEETFSIIKIEKDPGNKEVSIYLDHDVGYFALASWPGQRGPKIIPRVVGLSWDVSYLSRDKLVLKGKFKFGKKYSIIFPRNYKLDNKSYKK